MTVSVASVPVVRLRFASYYADNMVLQQAPQRAVIWGFVDLDDPSSPVSVYLLHEPKGHDKSKVSVYKAEIKYSKYGERGKKCTTCGEDLFV